MEGQEKKCFSSFEEKSLSTIREITRKNDSPSQTRKRSDQFIYTTWNASDIKLFIEHNQHFSPSDRNRDNVHIDDIHKKLLHCWLNTLIIYQWQRQCVCVLVSVSIARYKLAPNGSQRHKHPENSHYATNMASNTSTTEVARCFFCFIPPCLDVQCSLACQWFKWLMRYRTSVGWMINGSQSWLLASICSASPHMSSETKKDDFFCSFIT